MRNNELCLVMVLVSVAASMQSVRASEQPRVAGKHPDVRNGMDVVCRGSRIAVLPGTYVVNAKERKALGGEVAIPPIEKVEIKDLPVTLVADKVNSWLGGNRLIISKKDRRNLLPGSYTPGTLVIHDPSREDLKFSSLQDYTIDNTWGAFALTPSSRLKPGDKVKVTYTMSLRRVDALVIDKAGKPEIIKGTPSADCPELPAVPPGRFHLANIYRPFNAGDVLPVQVYVLGKPTPPVASVANTETLKPVLAKLKAGQPVTIVCWGDSVTNCGEASSPGNCYVGLFESMLKERFVSAKIKVINAGIGGSSTFSRLPKFAKEVLDFHPDVVTLEFVNDMGLPPDHMKKNYRQILKQTQEAGAVLVLITPHFVMPSWMNLPDGRGGETRLNVTFLREFAAANKVPLADAARRWEQLENIGMPYEILLRNGINHPEDRGHRFFAEELIRLFSSELGGRVERTN